MIKGVTTLSDYLSAKRLLMLKRKFSLFRYILIIFIIVCVWFSFGIVWGIFFTAIIVSILTFRFLITCRMFKACKELATEISWNEVGINIHSNLSSLTRLWSCFDKWYENGKVFVLYQNVGAGLGQIIPKSYFPNKELLMAFRNTLQDRITNQRHFSDRNHDDIHTAVGNLKNSADSSGIIFGFDQPNPTIDKSAVTDATKSLVFEKVSDLHSKYPYVYVYIAEEDNPFMEIGITENKKLAFTIYKNTNHVCLDVTNWSDILKKANDFLQKSLH